MNFFEEAIRELWTVKGRKDGKWFKTKMARWKKSLGTTNRNTKTRKIETLKEISKLTGYPVSFLKILLNYERIEEIEQDNKNKRNSLRCIHRTRK